MVIHTELACIFKRAIDRDPDVKHQVTVNMITRSGACARVRAQARGRAGAPLPARGAMALAPPPKLSRPDRKHVTINQYINPPKLSRPDRKHVTINQYINPPKLSWKLGKIRYDKLTTIMVECPERER
jgi:hypothetical protein